MLNKIKFSMLALGAFAMGLTSCSNENEPALNGNDGSILVKAPKMSAYSGDHFWSNDYSGTRSDAAQVTSEMVKTSLLDREHEKDIINEWLPEKNGNLKEGIDTDFLFYADSDLSVEFYPVFSQTTTPNSLGLYYWDADGEYHETIVWENMDPWNLTETDWNEPVKDSWVEDPNHWSGEGGYYERYGVTYSKGVQINVPAGCAFGFFWSGHNNTDETKYYSQSDKNEEVNCTDGEGNPIGGTSKIHAVTFTLEGKTYLGLEDWTDFDYQDWVFTCAQELNKVPASDFVPGDKNDPEVKPDPTPDPETPETPDVDEDLSTPAENLQHVEVNLALDGKDEDNSLISHLSIHVRHATDVEVFIPVPAAYYCDADDMAIVMEHKEELMKHGGPFKTIYNVGGNEVSLNVEFTDGGIRVWSDGITQEVIDYCREQFNDGITFEIWNYFNDPDMNLADGKLPISTEELKKCLDKATVKFLDEVPEAYINAFGKINGKYSDENPDANDFHVTPVDQIGYFDEPFEGPHYNDSDNNDIYMNKNREE